MLLYFLGGMVAGSLFVLLVYKILTAERFVAKSTFETIKTHRDELLQKLETAAAENGVLNKSLTEIKVEKKGVEEKLITFGGELENLQENSRAAFKNLASEIFDEKKKAFLEANKTELDTVIAPLKKDLDVFKKAIEDTRKEDIRDLTSLKDQIAGLKDLNTQLSDDAQNLARALKSDSKMQGTWGEDRLLFILESEGMQKYIDYTPQASYMDEAEEINRKPDVILHLPGNKHIIIDSKVSMDAYTGYFNAHEPESRQRYLKLHLKSIHDHIENLSAKSYHLLTGLNSPEYVFMFMPIESAITLALNESPELFNRAINKKVILITPSTLIATVKIVKMIWQKENQVKNVELIFKQCGALYDKFVSFLQEMQNLGAGLGTAQKAYKDAMARLTEGAKKGDTIIGRFERIKELEAKTNKQIPAKFLEELDLLPDTDTEVEPMVLIAENSDQRQPEK